MPNHGTRTLVLIRLGDGPSEFSQNFEDAEFIPIQTPENNLPLSPGSSEENGGIPVEQTTEPDENHKNEVQQQISEDDQNTVT